MKQSTLKIFDLFDSQSKSYLSALIGLMKVRKANGQNFEDCVYIRGGESKFLEEEAEIFISKLEDIIRTYREEN